MKFIKFPGIIEQRGIESIAYINLFSGKIFRVKKDIVKNINREVFYKELEQKDIGVCVSDDDFLLDFNFVFPNSIDNKLFVEILDNTIYLKYIVSEVGSVIYFSSKKLSKNEKKLICDEIKNYGYSGDIQILDYCKDKCPFLHKKPIINAYSYLFNSRYNPCWGLKLAIQKNGDVTPCLWSNKIVGNIMGDEMKIIEKRLKYYWSLTKDKFEVCKNCELNKICSDCRVMAERKHNTLFGKTLNCDYLSGKI